MALSIKDIATLAEPKFVCPISPDLARDQARLIWALAEPGRVRILALLLKYPAQMRVLDLIDSIGTLAPPTISYHLRVLQDAGVVRIEHSKDHKRVYTANRDRLVQAQRTITAILEVEK